MNFHHREIKFQVLLWDVSTQEILQTINCHVDMIYSLAVNRDGSYIATTSKDKKLRIIEPRTAIIISVKIIARHLPSLIILNVKIKLSNTEIAGRSVSSRYKMFESGIFGQWKGGYNRFLSTLRQTILDLGSTWLEKFIASRSYGQFKWCCHTILRLWYSNGK